MSEPSFTFLHAADLHIDSPLRGLSRYPGAPADRLRAAARDAFENVVELALERHVRFVIVAGDVFDGEWPDFNSGLWFASQLRRLTGAGIRVFWLRGNHDAESKVTKKLSWPEGVREFSHKRPSTERIDELDVALHGQGYAEQHVHDNLVLGYPDPVPGALNIGVLHTGLGGYAAHAPYAPCTVEQLVAKGYDYWALGHIHQREVVCEDPWIVFPGNIQGRHVHEVGPKGVSLVHVEGGRISAVEAVACDVARWVHLEVDLTGAGGAQDTDAGSARASDTGWMPRVDAALRSAVDDAGDRLVAARVTLHGSTLLDAALRGDAERVREDVRARAIDVSGDLWVERVKIETRPPSAPSPDDGLGALAGQLLGAELAPDAITQLSGELARLADRLPAAVLRTVNPKDPSEIAASVDSARRYLASLLVPHAGDRDPS